MPMYFMCDKQIYDADGISVYQICGMAFSGDWMYLIFLSSTCHLCVPLYLPIFGAGNNMIDPHVILAMLFNLILSSNLSFVLPVSK